MAAKRITVNEKLKRNIQMAVSDKMGLNDVDELEEASGEGELFVSPPDQWSEFENQVCDYTARKQREIIEAIYHVLGIEDGVSETEVKESVITTQPKAELKHLNERVEGAKHLLNRALLPHNEASMKSMIKNAVRRLDGKD